MEFRAVHIGKSYGDRMVLKDVSYHFREGRLYVIKGVSGCGKTTFLNILGGIEKEHEGEVVFDQPETSGQIRIGYLFQKSLLLSSLTVEENLRLICSDAEKIYALCDMCGVSRLLARRPEQLSGGERQRISVVRALLTDPQLLLCDEPTASLDGVNSEKIAALIAEQKQAGRIIIVATHDYCFDALADEILQLDYGTLLPAKENDHALQELLPEPQKSGDTFPPEEPAAAEGAKAPGGRMNKPYGLNPFRYVLRRRPGLFSFGSLFALVFGLLLVILTSTVRANFSREYQRILLRGYPTDLVIYYRYNMATFPEQYRSITTFYKDLHASEDNVEAMYLPVRKASVLIIEGMIPYGRFPNRADEVLASPEYAEAKFPGMDFNEVVGQKIRFCGLDLTISGVMVPDTDKKLQINYHNDVYYHTWYRHRTTHEILLIPYETLEKIGTDEDNNFQVAYVPNLAEDAVMLQAFMDFLKSNPNQYYSEMRKAERQVERVSGNITKLMTMTVGIICAFMIAVVSADLSYRRRELGYLQIFGVPKKTVVKLVFTEYLMRVLASLILAVVIGLLLITAYRLIFGAWLFPEARYTTRMCLGIVAAFLLTVFAVIRLFLRRSIMRLIH